MSNEMSVLEFIMWLMAIPSIVLFGFVLAFVWFGILMKIMEKICK